jgi:hypothetical protein
MVRQHALITYSLSTLDAFAEMLLRFVASHAAASRNWHAMATDNSNCLYRQTPAPSRHAATATANFLQLVGFTFSHGIAP